MALKVSFNLMKKLLTPSLGLVHHAQYVQQLQHVKVHYTSSLSTISTIVRTSQKLTDQRSLSTSQKKQYSSYIEFKIANTIVPLFELVYALYDCKVDEVIAILSDPDHLRFIQDMEKYLMSAASIGSVCTLAFVRAFLEKFQQLPEDYGRKAFDFCEQRGFKKFMEFTGLTKRFAGKTDHGKADEKDPGKADEKDPGKADGKDPGKADEKDPGKAADSVKNKDGGIKVIVNVFVAEVGNNIS